MPAPMINTAVSAWFLLPIRTSGQGLSPDIVVDTKLDREIVLRESSSFESMIKMLSSRRRRRSLIKKKREHPRHDLPSTDKRARAS
jgi:hypothetical protein